MQLKGSTVAITKHDIDSVSFSTAREGYDPEEVDMLLERVADEVDSFNRALVEAASRIETAEARAQAAERQAAQSAQMANSASSYSAEQQAASERQIAQALIAAQKSADELRDAARAESEKAYREAEQRARDIVRDALAEKQRILDEIERLRTSTEKFRSEYLGVLSRFTTEAQKVMPTLEESTPDISAEKKANEEAVQVLKEGDAAFEAPEVAQQQQMQSQSDAFSAAPAMSSASAGFSAAEKPAQPAAASNAQPSFDLDDDFDIDIEEID